MMMMGTAYRRGFFPEPNQFVATKGNAGTYRVGEELAFTANLGEPGNVIMFVVDGATSEWSIFEPGISFSSGGNTTVDGRSRGVVYVVEPPRGWHYIHGILYSGSLISSPNFSATSGTFSNIDAGTRALKYEINNLLRGRGKIRNGSTSIYVR